MSKAAALRRHKECRASIKPRPTVANVKVKRFWKPRRFWKARPKCVPAEDLEQAGYVYREDMLDRWTRGALSNIDLCTTAWKHTRSGGRGTPDLGVNPASKGQNHARAARRALGLNVVRQTIYFIMLPIWDWDTQSRVVAKFPIRLPHELLAEDFLKRPEKYCMKKIDPADYMVPAYSENEVVKQYGVGNVMPVGIYTDKARLGQSDCFYRGSVGVTFVRKRLTTFVIRGSQLCRCGCNGTCTTDVLQMEINHSLNLLQAKQYLQARLDGCPWLREDAHRSSLVHAVFPFPGAVVEYRGDLPERAMKAGLKTHKGALACMKCYAGNSKMHDKYGECTLHHWPFPTRTHESYVEEMLSHLVYAHIGSNDEKQELLNSLAWRQVYPWGRCVVGKRAKKFGLAAGDRVVIGESIWRSPWELEDLIPPFKIVLFRQKKQQRPRRCDAHVQLWYTWPRS